MKKIVQLEAFRKEIAGFPKETREDLFSLIYRYLNNERLHRSCFKTFWIDKGYRIQEFKVKDFRGNWRAISCLYQKENLVLIHAFHKKTQSLTEKERRIIRNRMKGLFL